MIGVTYWLRVTLPIGRTYQVAEDDLWSACSRPRRAASKMHLPSIAPVTFAGGRRGLAHIERIYGCGIDVDGDATLPEILTAWSGSYGYVHSTPSSTPDGPRWRIILLYREPLTDIDDARRVIRWAQRRTPGKVDMGTCDPSRLWFLPWAGAAHFVHAGLGGDALDGHAIAAEERHREEQERAARRAVTYAPPRRTDGSYAARALARACNEVARAGEGQRHTELAAEAFSIGTLVGAGLLAMHDAVSAFERAVDGWSNPRKTMQTIAYQLAEGAKHPREIRRSPWG